jgi:hypothetical protein
MFVEDLPMWGYIGDVDEEGIIIGETQGSSTYLFTHLHFLLGYNMNQIVSAKVTTDVRWSEILHPFSCVVQQPVRDISLFHIPLIVGSQSRHYRCESRKACPILLFGRMV